MFTASSDGRTSPPDYTLTSTQSLGGAPPVVAAFASDFTGADGGRTDFDGNYTLNWQAQGDVLKYEIEESTDGTNYTVIRQVEGNTTSISFDERAERYAQLSRALDHARTDRLLRHDSEQHREHHR